MGVRHEATGSEETKKAAQQQGKRPCPPFRTEAKGKRAVGGVKARQRTKVTAVEESKCNDALEREVK